MIPQKNPLIASGESVHANMMFKLWENPNPSVAFAAQDISLSSNDYDFLYWEFAFATTVPRSISVISSKGEGVMAECSGAGSLVYTQVRNIVCNSDTSFNVGTCSFQQAGQTATTDNLRMIPLAVYGFKKSLDITAIVSNVSTDATRCIMSDGVTSVETAIYQNAIYSETEHVVGKWIDGKVLYEKTVDCGAFPNTTTKNVAHGISNLDKVLDVRGVGYGSSGSYPLPFVQVSGGTVQGIRLNTNTTNIQIISSYDASSIPNSYVTLRYTKTT